MDEDDVPDPSEGGTQLGPSVDEEIEAAVGQGVGLHQIRLLDRIESYSHMGREHPEALRVSNFEIDKDNHLNYRTSKGDLVRFTKKPNQTQFLKTSTILGKPCC